ncbi:MAG: hypothetical protein AAFY17_00060 [Cyanobacteria bacterium J06642_11]
MFDRFFALMATLAVLAGTAAGFWVLGTPGQQRLIVGDQQRLEDLSAIASTLYWNYQDQEDYRLPEVLAPTDQRQDPLTQTPYQYNKINDVQYQLCADFATDSSTHKLANAPNQNWQHPQGRYCFEFDLNQSPPSLY